MTTSKSHTESMRHNADEKVDSGLNIVMLRGRLSRPAELRVLPSGDRLVALELSIAGAGAKTESVPVVWHDPPAAAQDLDVDQAVVVLGRVRRRFFRAGGATQSRTEVVAETVIPARQVKRARSLAAKAKARLESAEAEAG
ncbi:MAG: single-stranded DNA-binding protein [Actinobacteria bacterium]|nr:single-stranded DNA-binding protein [Actinomycetota bacterium]